jgi:SSS family transporter
MKSNLSFLDVAIILLYVLGTVLLGAWFSRRQRGLRTYFVGDRNVAWWLVLISIVATETSSVTFLSVPGVAFNAEGGNLTFLQLAFGYLIGRTLIAWLLLPQYLRGELFSAYQVLQKRFNTTVQRTASGLFLLTRTVADGLRLYLAALLLELFVQWTGGTSAIAVALAVLAIGLVTMCYTYLGGMQAVIWTDVIQFSVYLLGALLAGACMVRLLPSGWQEFFAVAQHAGKFKLIDLNPDPIQRYTLWTGLIGGTFLTMASHGADQMMVQRYLCSRSLGEARVALGLSGLVVLLQFLLFLLLGVGLYVLYAEGFFPEAAGLRGDQVFGSFIVHALPRGVIGLVLAAVLAASMSTLSSSMSSSASAFVTDFYQPLRPHRSERHYLLVSRLMTGFWGLARIAVALIAVWVLTNRSIVDAVLAVAGFTTGMILGLFLLGRVQRPVSSRAALVGLVVGFGAVTAAWLPSTWGKTLLAWPWYAPLGTATTVAAALLFQLFTNDGSLADRGAQPGFDQPG